MAIPPFCYFWVNMITELQYHELDHIKYSLLGVKSQQNCQPHLIGPIMLDRLEMISGRLEKLNIEVRSETESAMHQELKSLYILRDKLMLIFEPQLNSLGQWRNHAAWATENVN